MVARLCLAFILYLPVMSRAGETEKLKQESGILFGESRQNTGAVSFFRLPGRKAGPAAANAAAPKAMPPNIIPPPRFNRYDVPTWEILASFLVTVALPLAAAGAAQLGIQASIQASAGLPLIGWRVLGGLACGIWALACGWANPKQRMNKWVFGALMAGLGSFLPGGAAFLLSAVSMNQLLGPVASWIHSALKREP